MEAFGQWLRNWTAYITKPVVDSTGLKGGWDFDLKWNALGLPLGPEFVAGSTLRDAIDKQLGLKLDLEDAPIPVLVIDHVNEDPTDNAPDIAQKSHTDAANQNLRWRRSKPEQPARDIFQLGWRKEEV